jgi:acyl carrier protein
MTAASLLGPVTAAIRAAASGPLPAELGEAQSLVLDLGFDSLAMARLGLALEDQFGRSILLDGWLSLEAEPTMLTIGSLCIYLGSRLGTDERQDT